MMDQNFYVSSVMLAIKEKIVSNVIRLYVLVIIVYTIARNIASLAVVLIFVNSVNIRCLLILAS